MRDEAFLSDVLCFVCHLSAVKGLLGITNMLNKGVRAAKGCDSTRTWALLVSGALGGCLVLI